MKTFAGQAGRGGVGGRRVAGVAGRSAATIVVAPRCCARVIAADWPRALNELVGLSDSSLM